MHLGAQIGKLSRSRALAFYRAPQVRSNRSWLPHLIIRQTLLSVRDKSLGIPFSKRLLLIIWPFLAVVAVLMLVAYISMDLLSAIRAFVGGESLWSTAQKEVVYHLNNYAITHSQADYLKFKSATVIPLGDRKAREELEKRQPNYQVVYQGFIEGGIHVDDIPGMIRLFRWFRAMDDIDQAIALWAEGDVHIATLNQAGEELHRKIGAGETSAETLAPILTRIHTANDQLTPLERAFSYTLGSVSRKAHLLLLIALFTVAATLVLLGIYLSRRMLQQNEAFEQALRLSEERFRLAAAGSNDGLWDWNVLTDDVYRSPRFKELLGYADDELADQRMAFVSLLHPEDKDVALATIDAHLVHNSPYDLECRLQTKGNGYRWFRLRGQAVRNNEGKALRVAGAITDITDRKRVEERLRLANERLEQKVTERTQALTDANERLRELDQVKTQFFANVSHELRTPLTLILGPVRKLLEDYRRTEEERHDLEIVERNGQLLLKHVNDILDISKLEAGRMEIRYAEVDLASLARFTASHFETVAEERSLKYTIDLPESLHAEVDAEKIQRILLNLLSNAFKFNPIGGTVALSLRADDERAIFTISDNGPGIPPPLREAVFERFRQIDGGADRKSGGTGLGLSIVKEFVELHGGKVSVDESPTGGARFTIELPLAAPDGHEVRKSGCELGPELNKQAVAELRLPVRMPPVAGSMVGEDAPLILVVEDNPDMNAFVAKILAMKYRVETAFDGREGLDKALALQPNVIVSDVMMPRLTGEQLVRAVRSRPELAAVPIVLLTARADEASLIKSLQDGAQDYLSKPFLPEELLARVGRLIAEQQRNEASIRQAYTLLRTVTQEITDPVFVKDLDGQYVMVNPAGANLFGRSIENVIGRTAAELFPDDMAGKFDESDRKLVTDGTTFTYEETLPIEGSLRTFLVTKAPCRDNDGQIIGVIGIARDITDRIRSEENIRRLNADLEERVTQRTAELQAAIQELEAFSYSVSHDLRAPLRHIAIYSSMLENTCATLLTDSGRHHLERITKSAKRMDNLIRDLLEFSRVGKADFHQRPVNMDRLVAEVLQEVREAATGRTIEWEIDPLPEALGDRAMLRQVWVNLLSNAVKYTSRRERAIIRITHGGEGGKEVEFSVSDNGAGFDMQYADRLFGVFQRLHRNEDFEGTGIGLANVRRIVSRHGGRTWAEGKINEGATFYFTLPSAK